MKRVKICKNGLLSGYLEESELKGIYRFIYDDNYTGGGISFTMPAGKRIWEFKRFPEFFENLLPEELMLEGMCKTREIGKTDYISQLIAAGKNLLGDIEVTEER